MFVMHTSDAAWSSMFPAHVPSSPMRSTYASHFSSSSMNGSKSSLLARMYCSVSDRRCMCSASSPHR